MVQLQTVALHYSDGSAKLSAATKNSETKDAPKDSINTKLMRQFDQFYKKTEHLAENYCRKFIDFARGGSHAYVADRRYFEYFALDTHALTCELKQIC
jgi:hypothetical protein